MKLFVVAVYDKAVKSYMQPMFFRSGPEAIRSFRDACSDGKSVFCAHPEDYYLEILGVFDDASGELIEHKEVLITAQACVHILTPENSGVYGPTGP